MTPADALVKIESQIAEDVGRLARKFRADAAAGGVDPEVVDELLAQSLEEIEVSMVQVRCAVLAALQK